MRVSSYVTPAFPRFAAEAALVVNAHNGHERWTGAEWNEYVTGAERLGQMVTARLVECPPSRPPIVVLCGSTRFYDEFQRANYELTMAGRIVLSVGFYPHNPQVHGEAVGCTPEQKVSLDELHKRKIDLADQVLVLNVGGYIGESTRSEIDYAVRHGKPVRYLEGGSNHA